MIDYTYLHITNILIVYINFSIQLFNKIMISRNNNHQKHTVCPYVPISHPENNLNDVYVPKYLLLTRYTMWLCTGCVVPLETFKCDFRGNRKLLIHFESVAECRSMMHQNKKAFTGSTINFNIQFIYFIP